MKAKKSCLELVIISAALEPYLKELIIDSAGQFPMRRVVTRKGKLTVTPSDHFPLILTFSNLQEAKKVQSKSVCCNLNKPNGWRNYKRLTEKNSDKFVTLIEDNTKSIEQIMDDFEKNLNKIKFEEIGSKISIGEAKPKRTSSEAIR